MKSEWKYSIKHDQACKVIDVVALWGIDVYTIWLPGTEQVSRVSEEELKPLDSLESASKNEISYIAAAGRILRALSENTLLAPIDSSVIPLPHQIHALSRAMATDKVRYLLADEVGLGKTIEAGLVVREQKLRGLTRRILVVAPKGLVSQWVSEMLVHFGETFRLILPEDIKTLKRLRPEPANERGGRNRNSEQSQSDNPWLLFSQVVVPMDSVKPLEKRKGWSTEQLAEYNRDRFEGLISADWDLIIVDEAHRLGGSTDQVARFKLGQGLADASPYLLLLSATPHQGKSEAFRRLMSLVDADAFPDDESISPERVHSYVIRTEKRAAITADGDPLFKPRQTQLATIGWEDRHKSQQLLYEAVTEYVRDGYNQAVKEKRSYVGFLMILMQRLVVSSTRAIRTTLERRLLALAEPEEQLTLFPDDDWSDLDGQEQLDTILRTRLKALKNERDEVKFLLAAASQCEGQGPDAKAEALLDWIYRLQSEESDAELKILIFTEFVPTQQMLQEFLNARGISVTCLNGSMDMEKRKRVQRDFAKDVRVLISTDAGGEGLNLQFCHVVVNYDIPWNPMRLEQRIGRVDRIGQTHQVRAINFVFEDSVEFRVREVLEEKLSIILKEFGIDKTGDVLDSAEAGQVFDDVYVKAILKPDEIEQTVDRVVKRLRTDVEDSRSTASVLGATESLDPSIAQSFISSPLADWVERMATCFIKSGGGQAESDGKKWKLRWPDSITQDDVVFSTKDAQEGTALHLTIEEPNIRRILHELPKAVPGQPISAVTVQNIGDGIVGMWSLWKISISGRDVEYNRILPIFVSDDGKTFGPTALHIWDQLVMGLFRLTSRFISDSDQDRYLRNRKVAEELGQSVFDALLREYQEELNRERKKIQYAFDARRRVIQKIGLPEVRNHRIAVLEEERRKTIESIEERAQVYPEMSPLLLVRVMESSNG